MKKLILMGNGHAAYDAFSNIIKYFNVEGIILPSLDDKIKMLAEENNIKISCELSDVFLWEPECIIMISYGKLLPEEIINKYEVINVHYGLLPKYRGLHTVAWALINGEKEIGYTVHLVNDKIDGGDIIFQQAIEVNDDDNVWTIMEKLDALMSKNICSILDNYFKGNIKPIKQDDSKATYFARRNITDCYIDWSLPSEVLFNFIRALVPPYPGAFTVYKGKKIIITEAEKYNTPEYTEVCGHVVNRIPGKGVLVKTGDGVLLIKKIKTQDGNEICADKFFKSTGARLGINLVEMQLRKLKLI